MHAKREPSNIKFTTKSTVWLAAKRYFIIKQSIKKQKNNDYKELSHLLTKISYPCLILELEAPLARYKPIPSSSLTWKRILREAVSMKVLSTSIMPLSKLIPSKRWKMKKCCSKRDINRAIVALGNRPALCWWMKAKQGMSSCFSRLPRKYLQNHQEIVRSASRWDILLAEKDCSSLIYPETYALNRWPMHACWMKILQTRIKTKLARTALSR